MNALLQYIGCGWLPLWACEDSIIGATMGAELLLLIGIVLVGWVFINALRAWSDVSQLGRIFAALLAGVILGYAVHG